MKHHKHHKHHRKSRGGEMSARDDYAGSGEPNVVKEAKKMRRGGRLDADGDYDGDKKHRARKKHGGSVGSDKSPFTSAGGGKASSHPFSSAHRG